MKIIHDNICEIIFCNNIFFFLHSEERWRRKLHYQINHIKNISSSNYISFHITQNITHKVDINEMRKKSENVSFFFVYFCWHCMKKGLFSFRFIKLWLQRADREINLSIYDCLHITQNKAIIFWWLKFFF